MNATASPDDDDSVDNHLDDDDLVSRPDIKAWEPTVMDPFPTFRCTHTKANGERCNNNAINGMMPENAKCHAHGGRTPTVKEKARSRVDAARMKIIDDAPAAAEVLKSLTLEGTADNIRLKAATEILDRAGIRGGVEIDVSGEVEVNSAAQVRERLAKLALGLPTDEDVVEGEVVEDDNGEPEKDDEAEA